MELAGRVAEAWRSAMDKGLDRTVLLCDFQVRPHLAALLARQIPQLPVLAYDEIVIGTKVEPVETVSLQSAPIDAEVMAGR